MMQSGPHEGRWKAGLKQELVVNTSPLLGHNAEDEVKGQAASAGIMPRHREAGEQTIINDTGDRIKK